MLHHMSPLYYTSSITTTIEEATCLVYQVIKQPKHSYHFQCVTIVYTMNRVCIWAMYKGKWRWMEIQVVRMADPINSDSTGKLEH